MSVAHSPAPAPGGDGDAAREKALLEEIGLTVKALDAKFVVRRELPSCAPGGAFSLTVRRKPANEGADGDLVSVTFPGEHFMPDGVTPTAALAALFECCEPAPFGRGGETVHDERVRKALVIPAARVAAVEGIDLSAVTDVVRRKLAPFAGAVTAELHKVNIYPPGGHFAAHRDTPLGTDMLGTLVIQLPTQHTGGTLIVR
jgi:hypothetical protein